MLSVFENSGMSIVIAKAAQKYQVQAVETVYRGHPIKDNEDLCRTARVRPSDDLRSAPGAWSHTIWITF
jgi:hypothetical protein